MARRPEEEGEGTASPESPSAGGAGSGGVPDDGHISTKDGSVRVQVDSRLADYDVMKPIGALRASRGGGRTRCCCCASSTRPLTDTWCRYRARRAGKGKFSTVYRAKAKDGGDLVALKKIQIFDMMDEKSREKCLKEIRLVQQLDHPNIIRYLDSFIEDNQLHLVFEYAEAGDLKRQLRKAREREARFDERVIWKYFSQIAEALRHMHERRVMHRDLKPANVFLTLNGTVKVGDLGLGRHFSEATMEAYSKVGTPLYMSPEVLRGKGYEWKSDVWSLGCVLYELAMLTSPFKEEGLNLYGLFQKITKGDYTPVSEVYSKDLRDLAHRMLSIDPAGRPDMEEVCEVAMRMREYTQRLRQQQLAQRQAAADAAAEAEAEADARRAPDPEAAAAEEAAEAAAADAAEAGQGGGDTGATAAAAAVAAAGSRDIADADRVRIAAERAEKERAALAAAARDDRGAAERGDGGRGAHRPGNGGGERAGGGFDASGGKRSEASAFPRAGTPTTAARPREGSGGGTGPREATRPEPAAMPVTSAARVPRVTAPDVGLLLVMESMHEKLKLLQYETRFAEKHRGGQWFPRSYFGASGGASNFEQFSDFVQLCGWLLGLLGSSVDLGDDAKYGNPMTTAGSILVAVGELGAPAFIVSMTPQQLAKGHGLQVCHVLHFLADAALEREGWRWLAPEHGMDDEVLEDDGEGASDHEIRDTGEDGVHDDIDAGVSDDEDNIYARADPPSPTALERQSAIEATVDPTAWRAELVRVQDRLRMDSRDVAATMASWRGHLQSMTEHSAVLAEATGSSAASARGAGAGGSKHGVLRTVASLSEECKDALERVRAGEARIASLADISELVEVHERASGSLSELRTNADELNVETNRLTAEAGELSDAVRAVKDELDERGGSMTNTAPLQKIRAALVKIKKESQEMVVRLGIARVELARHQMAAASERRAAARAGGSPGSRGGPTLDDEEVGSDDDHSNWSDDADSV